MEARHILDKAIKKTIGTGAETKVWEDVWIQTEPARPAKPRSAIIDPDLRVHHLIDFERKKWNMELVNAFIADEDIPRILAMRISRTGQRDSYVWKHTKCGNYTIRSGYKVAVEQRRSSQPQAVTEPSLNGLKKEIWKLKTSRKIKLFIWQAISGFVASASKLKERHCGSDSTCQRCGAEQETVNHILFECPPAVRYWALSNIPTSPGQFPCTSIFVNVETLLKYSKECNDLGISVAVFPWIMWYQWKARNNKCFNNQDTSPLDTLHLACQEAEAWKMAQMVETTCTEEENNQTRRPATGETETTNS